MPKSQRARKSKRSPARPKRRRQPIIEKVKRAASRAAGKELTPKVRARKALGLPVDFVPATDLTGLLDEVPLTYHACAYLKHVTDCPDALAVVKLYNKLAPVERDAISLEELCARASYKAKPDLPATKVDFHKVFGALCGEVARIHGGEASMLAAIAAPTMVKSAFRAGMLTLDGHADRKLILQTVGVAPVPKNNITNVSVRDSVIDNRKQTANFNRVPTLEEVVKDTDSVLYDGDHLSPATLDAE